MGAVYNIGVPLSLKEQAEESCQRRIERSKKEPLLFSYFNMIINDSESRIHNIIGQTGSGKSTLALLYLMRKYDCDIEEIFDKIVWRPDYFIEKYEEGRQVIVWDDAGIWFRLLARMPWDPLAITLNSIFDVGRLHVPLVIFTMVTDRDLPRGIRYNSFIYRSRTRVWKIGFDKEHGVKRAKAVTQFRREKQDWSQSYWDASNEYVYKFYHFRDNDPFYLVYLELRRKYAKFFLKFAKKNMDKSKLWKLLQEKA